MFPYRFQKEPGGVWEGSLDIEGGDNEVHRVHVGDGVLEEDVFVWGPARDGLPEASGYVGVQVGADVVQEVREPSSCLTVVMVRWPVSVMALLRWRMAL